MVECGFVSNPEENKLLQNSEYQQKMAYSIFAGTNGVLYGK
jgi:N-acetylmuramoyl-L-alanine amidase